MFLIIQVRDSLGVYWLSAGVAYVLHLAVEGPVIAGDALLFRRRAARTPRDGATVDEVCHTDDLKNSQQKAGTGFRSIMLNPVDLKQIYKL